MKKNYHGHHAKCCTDENITDWPNGSGYAECEVCHRMFVIFFEKSLLEQVGDYFKK